MATAWYDYEIISDYGYQGSTYNNTDVEDPIDTPLTAPLSGKITDLGYPAWGGQVTVQADDPSQIGGYPYYFLIHMDALNPNLHVGTHVAQGAFLGYSGGQYPGQPGITYPSLPKGYSHHDTQHSHSTGPHLDIGVSDSPQGSWDLSKTWSDALVNIARKLKINANVTGGGGPTALSNPATKQDWAESLLAALGNDSPDQAQVEFVSAWEHAESGGSGGAQNNPLNTEESNTPGVVSNFNPQGVKNYDTYAHGIQAEAKVLNNGLYDPLLQALKNPGPASDAALGIPGGQPSSGVIQSLDTWGTSDWSTIYGNLGAGSEPINVFGDPGGPEPPPPTGGNPLSGVLPTWLTTPPWQNPDLLNAVERGAAIVMGLGLMFAGVTIAATSATQKIVPPQVVKEVVGAAGAPTSAAGAASQATQREHSQVETTRQADTTRVKKAEAGIERHKKAIEKAQSKKAA